MNGTNYSFDTNALIHFFKGNPNLKQFTTAPIYLSIITVIEFLSFPDIKEADKNLLFDFINEVKVVSLSLDDIVLLNTITQIRSLYKLKLPDAIIAATALSHRATLITNDKHFSKIPSLNIITY